MKSEAVFDGVPISAQVKLIRGNQHVAQWNLLNPIIYWRGSIDFDGRKRALVASRLGIRKIPVVVYGHHEK